ncbi:MAG: hypothetical protein LBC26_00150 [Oscillospiraceae bacterium]|jgi:Fic family protein|nr:hypothetical protein [Oscillospiraceae bacterium]
MNNTFKTIDTNLLKIDFSALPMSQPYFWLVDQQAREIIRILKAAQESRKQKEANEEAYRQETIRSLHAIEENTTSLHTLVDLSNKSNEQQDEIISIIAELLTIKRAKSKGEDQSIYTKVMSRMTQTTKDVETFLKTVHWLMIIWQFVQSTNLP